MLKKHPIQNDTRMQLVYYMCFLHNIVNERMDKPKFDCEKAFDVWGGHCGCSK